MPTCGAGTVRYSLGRIQVKYGEMEHRQNVGCTWARTLSGQNRNRIRGGMKVQIENSGGGVLGECGGGRQCREKQCAGSPTPQAGRIE